MRIAYFDCLSGISGDMTLGALIDLGVPVVVLNEAVRSVLDNVRIEAEPVRRKNFRATLAKVHAPHEHVHRHLSGILAMIEQSQLSDHNKKQASDIFRMIAEAEAKVHGVDVEKIHFHEVGAADSIADIVGAVAGLDYLHVDEIYASPVPTGCGTIKIAHGTCSIPAPATAELLREIPIAASDIPFELTTPTGAVLLKYFARHFGSLPAMTIQSVGIGAGGRDLEQQANILRILIGQLETETENLHTHSVVRPHSAPEHQYEDLIENIHRFDQKTSHQHDQHELPHRHETSANHEKNLPITETAWIVETNIDDASGELIGHCIEQLWNISPLDVWTTPIQMKKQRPGVTVSILCRRDQIGTVESILFTETTTIGVRRFPVERTVLHRELCQIETQWGKIDAKKVVLPNSNEKITPEFESVKRLAAEHNISVREIFERK
ncbi:MAG: nickel pincer cofactor biosynthesis protein LarC [Planctomycetaceae bacterium]|jgi:uncharacterized protein (TIGR00299 family) protein|nr:nickel pincer cofactor biosynthesis protein LarC [Planctomycetaceae bacterium]